MYDYHLLNPRDFTESLAWLRSHRPALGLEVTDKNLAKACSLGNIDPQHTGENAQVAAIEEATRCKLPPEGATLVTIRPDTDALGAMAVLTARAAGQDVDPARVAEIATADKERTGPWPGPGQVRADVVTDTAILNAVCMDHRTPLQDRVEVVRRWLTGEDIPGWQEIRRTLEEEAAAALAATTVNVVDGVAVVTSTHRKGVDLGYQQAPVVVASNPEFRLNGGEPHLKHTIARWNTATLPGMDWAGMVATLNGADPTSRITPDMVREYQQAVTAWAVSATEDAVTGYIPDEEGVRRAMEDQPELPEFPFPPQWGGNSSIVGSPQGTGSGLTTEQVARIVREYLP